MTSWQEKKKNLPPAIPPTFEPFPISEWRKYWRTRSKYWVYCYSDQTVKACQSLDEAKSIAATVRGRWFQYETEQTVEAVLRNMS